MIRVLLVDDHALVREGLHRLLQDCGDIEVVGAIRKVAAGGSSLPPALSEGLPRRYAHRGAPTSPLETLSDRELQVLKHLAEGRAGRAIAQELHLSVKTVDTYRARLLAKLELHSTAELIRFALRHGVIEDAW